MRYRLKLATWTVVRENGEPSPHVLRSPEAVAALACDLVRAHDDDRERFFSVYTNSQYRVRFFEVIAVGTQQAALVHPREVFGPALREGACAIFVVHSHPSGDPEPSPEDLALTRRLHQCGVLLGVRLVEHVIVACGTWRWVSLRERGMMDEGGK